MVDRAGVARVEAHERMARTDAARSRLSSEAERLARLRSSSVVPEACGPEIVQVAPARGPVETWIADECVTKADGTQHTQSAMWHGRTGARRSDVFDRMARAATAKSSDPILTPGQVAMGRDYRSLYERHATAGVQCSSLEATAQRGGSSGGGSFIDAVLADREKLARLRKRVGDGVALRKVRPSRRGGVGAAPITDRRLVDMVCLEDASVADVLKAHGWSAGRNVAKLSVSLSQALERMQGPRPRQRRFCTRFIGEM